MSSVEQWPPGAIVSGNLTGHAARLIVSSVHRGALSVRVFSSPEFDVDLDDVEVTDGFAPFARAGELRWI